MDVEIYENKKASFLEKLYLNDTNRINLMKETILQSESQGWIEERRKRLTASYFGYVCNKLPRTKCDYIVKRFLYNYKETDEMEYGKRHEKDALCAIKEMNIEVEPCGLMTQNYLFWLPH